MADLTQSLKYHTPQEERHPSFMFVSAGGLSRKEEGLRTTNKQISYWDEKERIVIPHPNNYNPIKPSANNSQF